MNTHIHFAERGTTAVITQECRRQPVAKEDWMDAEELKNYRPVSNLTFLLKLVEEVVSSRLASRLNTHGLMPQLQCAYRRHHSTESALC